MSRTMTTLTSWLAFIWSVVAMGVPIVRHFSSLLPSHALNFISEVEHTMDTHVTQASKRLSVEDFSRLLNVLAEGTGGSGLHVGQRERLVHLGKVILHDAPQGRLNASSFHPVDKRSQAP